VQRGSGLGISGTDTEARETIETHEQIAFLHQKCQRQSRAWLAVAKW
jgi:hypothetical protein